MKRILCSALLPCAVGLVFLPPLANAEPQWIWSAKQAQPNEKALFRTTFTVPVNIKSAKLSFSCDNSATATLNGRPAAESKDWKRPAKADVTKLLRTGENELRIEGRNEDGVAALVAVLTIETTDGKKQTIETGDNWQVQARGSATFAPATVIAKYGAEPWGSSSTSTPAARVAEAATDPASLQVPKGFKVELLYTVPKEEQGSWVSMTVDPKGRLIVCDQYGDLYRVTVPPIGRSEGTKVEPLKSTHRRSARAALRLRQPLRDGQREAGERALAPAGYRWRRSVRQGGSPPQVRRRAASTARTASCSRRTASRSTSRMATTPSRRSHSRNLAPPVGQEDHLLPRMWDANGHARASSPPAATSARPIPTARTWSSSRSASATSTTSPSIANGELFTYDSDMEWDMGSPWYRPTRITHATSGSDLGWRSGAGKWPAYYPDSLPPVLDIGPGSPTGTVFGTGAKFPAKYQRALFAADWTYGTMYAIHLTPQGASFRAEKEEFVAGKPLPLTDVVIHPQDGAMYFTIGGRKTQSALYRVTYTGSEPTHPATTVPPTAGSQAAPAARSAAHTRCRAEGRRPRLAAPRATRTASCASPRVSRWSTARRRMERARPERKESRRGCRSAHRARPRGRQVAAAAVPRSAQPASISPRCEPEVPGSACCAPGSSTSPAWANPRRKWPRRSPRSSTPSIPNKDGRANRELVSLLVYLDSPDRRRQDRGGDGHGARRRDGSRDRRSPQPSRRLRPRRAGVSSSRPNRQQIAYAFALRNATAGWTPELRKAFFAWFPRTHEWKGGNSFTKFLDNIRNEALANVVTDEANAPR